jgi:hypothetical protein
MQVFKPSCSGVKEEGRVAREIERQGDREIQMERDRER